MTLKMRLRGQSFVSARSQGKEGSGPGLFGPGLFSIKGGEKSFFKKH